MTYDFETSRPAFEEAKQSIELCRQKVFTAIRKLGTCTDKQLAEYLGWEINRVTPRRNELVVSNLIEMAKKDLDHTGKRKVNWWREKKIIVGNLSQPNLFQ